jgi:hypothetical protein
MYDPRAWAENTPAQHCTATAAWRTTELSGLRIARFFGKNTQTTVLKPLASNAINGSKMQTHFKAANPARTQVN